MSSVRRLLFYSCVGGACVSALVAFGSTAGVPLRAQSAEKTFARDVAPIIYDNCASCHRPGEAAPFSLLSYDDVKQRARLIVEATAHHVMPPWQPDDSAHELAGVRRLSDLQIATIREWAEGGQLEGASGDLPPAPDYSKPWRLGIPDAVVTLGEPFTLAADGPDVFRNFVLPLPLGTRRYVKAIEFRPGNARVVHHARILLDDTGDVRRLDAADPSPGFGGMDVPGAKFPDGHFLGWAPGKMPDTEAYPWPIEPGTDFVLQLHLKPTGRAEAVQPSIAVYFTDQPPAATPTMLRLGVKTIDIPAGAEHHEIVDTYLLPVDVIVNSVYPHAHYLAKEMTISAKKPDGSIEPLLHIPNWNFNWQDEYTYRRPIELHKGTTIQMRYVYDNSASNPHNPSQPPRRVVFGSETTDEMGELLLQVLPKKPSELPKLRADVMRKNLLSDIDGEEKRLRDRPEDVETRNALGVAYAKLGKNVEAAKQFRETVRIAPAHAQANYNLGVIAMAERRFDEAESRFRRALETDPSYAEAHNNLGVLLETTGRSDDALAEYQRAIAARPTNAAALTNFGRTLLNRGDVDGAITPLKKALTISPDSADALYTLARAALAQRRGRDAAQLLKRALASRPDGVQILVDYAWLLVSDPDVYNPAEAVKMAERANQLSGNSSPAVLDALAAAYAADNRGDLAVRTAQRAFQRALAVRDERLAALIRQRLETYGQTEPGTGNPIE